MLDQANKKSHMIRKLMMLLLFTVMTFSQALTQKRPRDLGIKIGVMKPGGQNAITDVPGVKVGHETLIEGTDIRTGVTAIIPHDKDIFQWKCPAAIYIGNGFGKLAGYSQVEELGNIETPIILTNTLSVPVGVQGLIEYTLLKEGNEEVRSVNAVVGETNDGYLNDIRAMSITTNHVMNALTKAKNGFVEEGNVGAGTGTRAFGYKGGIGTSSRILPKQLGGYTIGVLIQSNFGGVLQIDGAPIGEILNNYYFRNQIEDADGSCMIVVATNAPVDARNLKRLAKRAMLGLAKTGGIASNGSGDYVIAFSNFRKNLIPHSSKKEVEKKMTLRNEEMTSLFMATIEATEEAIINSLFAATTLQGHQGRTAEALPIEQVLEVIHDR